jgi:hypothetical protein
MKFRFLCLLLLTLLSGLAHSQSAEPLDFSKAWFTPELLVSNDAICEAFHQDAVVKFLAGRPIYEQYYHFLRDVEPDFLGMQSFDIYDPAWTSATPVPPEDAARLAWNPSLTIDGQQVFLDKYEDVGCGQACNSYQLRVSATAEFPERPEPDSLPPMSPSGFQLFQASDGTYWVVVLTGEGDTGIVTNGRVGGEDRLQLYRIPADGAWQVACDVRLRPAADAQPDVSSYQLALQAVEALRSNVQALLGTSGRCGSSAALARWTTEFGLNLPDVMYRPWGWRQENRREDFAYADDMASLADWSLLGVSEYNAFQAYLAQLEQTVGMLAGFYEESYGWPRGLAESIARDATTTLIASAIRTYRFAPFADAEREIRRAILEGMPLEDFARISYDFSQPTTDLYADGLSSIAIGSPELLQYILANGSDPNSTNDFGKTPLMYAAQYNNLEAARVLLAAGADPNAATDHPTNTCYYNLRTFNMTPLHYAARYASPEFIKLLLDNGAATFIESNGLRGAATPQAWLRLYTDPAGEEINPNLPADRIAQVDAWLEPTASDAQLQSVVLDAERLYQAGNATAAFQKLELALQIDADNQRALSDMSLVALRVDKLVEAFDSAEKLLASDADDRTKANAWFNKGLICEATGPKGEFRGHYLCDDGALHPFRRAQLLQPTEARANKLADLFANRVISYCLVPNGGSGMKINFAYMGSQSDAAGLAINVLHDSDRSIEPEMLAWTARFQDGEREIVPARFLELELGAQTLTVFTTDAFLQFPYNVGNYTCQSDSDADAGSDTVR